MAEATYSLFAVNEQPAADEETAAAVVSYVMAPSWEKAREVLEEHPEILTHESVDRLKSLAVDANNKGDHSAAEIFDRCGDQLQLCVTYGLEAAFYGLHDGVLPEPNPTAPTGYTIRIPEETRQRLLDGYEAFVEARHSPAEQLGILSEYPELLTEANDLLIKEMIETMPRLGLESGEGPVRFYGNLLRACRIDGVEAGFTQVEGGVVAFFPEDVRNLLDECYAAIRGDDPKGWVAAETRLRVALGDPRLADAHRATRGFLHHALGESAWQRYMDGDLGGLNQAVDSWREAIESSPQGASELAGRLSNLAIALQRRFLTYSDRGDIDDAIDAHRDSVARTREGMHTSHGPVNLRIRLNNLGLALRYRAEGGVLESAPREQADLEASIEALDEALDLVESTEYPAEKAFLAAASTNLAVSLGARFGRTGDGANLDGAIGLLQEAAILSEGTPELAGILNNLGGAHHERYEATPLHRDEDLGQGVSALRRACQLSLVGRPEAGLKAARTWVAWAFDRLSFDEAAEACGYGVSIQERLFKTQALREHKETWLSQASGLAVRGAYASAVTGDADGAVLIAERGRAMLLAEALERHRFDLAHLADAGHDDLVDRFSRAADLVDVLRRAELELAGTDDTLPVRLSAALSQLDDATRTIREVEGFDRFLDPPTLDDIRRAGHRQAVIYLAASEAGGVALFVSDQGEVSSRELPELTEEVVRQQVEGFRAAYDARTYDMSRWKDTIDAVTSWLWKSMMSKVVEELKEADEAVLVPMGALGFLPLHAAWTHDAAHPTGKRYALDSLAFSYAPSSLALSAAASIAEQTKVNHLVVVDEPIPAPPGWPALSHSYAEVEAAMAAIRDGEEVPGAQANRRTVLEALGRADLFHLSCHGRASLSEPLDSAVFLADGEPLALREILQQQLSCRLGVISACESGVPGEELPDEVIGLPTGLLQAGTAGLVASLWSVPGLGTAILMFAFYELWAGSERSPAQALQQAQMWVRDTTNAEKAKYFRDRRPGSGHRMESEAARSLYRELQLLEPEPRQFADVYEWGAFAHIGV